MGAENNIVSKTRVISYKDKNEAIKDLDSILHKGDLIFSKGIPRHEVVLVICY